MAPANVIRLLQKGRPCRLPHVTTSGRQKVAHTGIDGHRRQDTFTASFGRVKQHGAVGRDGRGLIETGGGQHAQIPGYQVLRSNMEYPLASVHHHQGAAIRRQAWLGIVGTLKSEPFDPATGDGQFIDLRRTTAVGSKQNGFAIGRPGGLGVDGKVLSQPGKAARRQTKQVYFRVAVLGQYQSEAATIGSI